MPLRSNRDLLDPFPKQPELTKPVAVTTRESMLVLLIACLLIAARNPMLLMKGRIWAEEGTVYLRFAWENAPTHALLAHHQGYYSLVPNLVGLLAARWIPLAAVPLVFVWSAALIQLIAAWLVFDAEVFTTFRTKVFAVCVVLFTPSSAEVWLNVTNSQSYLLLCAIAVLFSSPAKTYKIVVLTVACLTGVLSCLLFPFFLVKAYYLRSRTALTQAFVVVSCTIVQIVVILTIGLRHTHHSINYLAQAALVKNSFLLFGTGFSAYRLSDFLIAHPAAGTAASPIIFLVFLGCLCVLSFRGGRLATGIFLIGIWIELFSVATGLNMSRSALRPYFNGRYFFALNACIGLSLVCVYQNSKSVAARRISTILLVLILFSGTIECWKTRSVAPPLYQWQSDVVQWRAHPDSPLPIDPSSWSALYLTPGHPDLLLPDDTYDSTREP